MYLSVIDCYLTLLFVLHVSASYVAPHSLHDISVADQVAAGIDLSKDIPTARNSDDDLSQCWTSWSSYWGAHTMNVTTFTSTLAQSFLTTTEITGQITNILTETTAKYGTTTYTVAPTLTPSCTLPTSVPQCQASWEIWASAEVLPSPTATGNCTVILPPYPACATLVDIAASSWSARISSAITPQCSQASIGGEMCQSLRDVYVTGTNMQLYPSGLGFDALFSNGYLGQVVPVTLPGSKLVTSHAYSWPTSLSFAPSCTLGCARCAVTGETVRLLYWPTAMRSRTDAAIVTIATLGTTLTSPTNYISLRTMYASDACKGVGGIYYSTILPIPTSSTLSSQWGAPYPYDAHLFQMMSQVYIGTASFDYADLRGPVPESIYSSQPWCAFYTVSRWASGDVSNVTCPQTRSYEPILVVPREVFNSVDPAWSTCSLDVRGLYDPPIALSVEASLAVPTVTAPGATTTIPPMPASLLQQVAASKTGGYLLSEPSITSQTTSDVGGNAADFPSRTGFV